jgi:hypothetical protein
MSFSFIIIETSGLHPSTIKKRKEQKERRKEGRRKGWKEGEREGRR